MDIDITCNPDTGTDYHLRALGFRDRKDLRVLAADNKVFSDGLIVCKPDWLIQNLRTGEILDISYKSRLLGESRSETAYEFWQLAAEYTCLLDALKPFAGVNPKIRTAIVYGDGRILKVEVKPDDVDEIMRAAMDCPTHLYFIGQEPRPRDTVSASKLARYMVDPYYTDPKFDQWNRAQAGIRAHNLVKSFGPRFIVGRAQPH